MLKILARYTLLVLMSQFVACGKAEPGEVDNIENEQVLPEPSAHFIEEDIEPPEPPPLPLHPDKFVIFKAEFSQASLERQQVLFKQMQEYLQSDFSYMFLGDPVELNFSCAVHMCMEEEILALMLNAKDAEIGMYVAKLLWKIKSRKYAAALLKKMDDGSFKGDDFRHFKAKVKTETSPENLIVLMDESPAWAIWLAGLKPDPQLTSLMLKKLKKKPKADLIHALGYSGDKRVLLALFALLQGDDDALAGHAAQALGNFALPQVEGALIVFLSKKSNWSNAHASISLGKIGTEKAIPALKIIANDPSYTGAISRAWSAQQAIQQIKKRMKMK